MQPYAADFISYEDYQLFQKIRMAALALPDLDLGVDESDKKIIFSCHILARAFAKVFSLRYADGYFYSAYDHSWLITPAGHIIDIYPVAVISGPIMMVGISSGSPASLLYQIKSAKNISRGRFSKPSFHRAVRRTISCLKKINL